MFYRKYNAERQNLPANLKVRRKGSLYIQTYLKNNCKLLAYCGLTVGGMIREYYKEDGIKVDRHFIKRLKDGIIEACGFTFLVHISNYWDFPAPSLFRGDFNEAEALAYIRQYGGDSTFNRLHPKGSLFRFEKIEGKRVKVPIIEP